MNAPSDMPDSGDVEISRPHKNAIRDLRSGIPGELAAAIAHELNQPLTAILGNAQAARRFINSGDISREDLLANLDEIIRDTKRAGGMIHSLQARGAEAPQQHP